MTDPASLFPELPRSRAEAAQLGLKHYYTSKPCIRGHYDIRSTKGAECRMCHRDKLWKSDTTSGIPVSAEGKRQAVRRLIMGGVPFFAAFDRVPGSKAALVRKIGSAPTAFTGWRARGQVPRERREKIAVALNITASRIPVQRDPIDLVRADIRAGVPVFEALERRKAWRPVLIALGNKECGRWRRNGVPPHRAPAMARLLGCDPKLIPLSRGWHRPSFSEEEKRMHAEIRRTPEFRARMRAVAAARTPTPKDNKGRFSSHAQQVAKPRYRDKLDRIAGAYGFGASSLA